MILSPSLLLPAIENGELIKGLSDRDLRNPEGAGFDLQVDAVHQITGPGALLKDTRHTGSTENVLPKLDASKGLIINLCAQGLYLVTTKEEFFLERNMLAVFHPRSTLFRSGVIFQSGVAPYGYKGRMTFLLYVANPHGFSLEIGARFAHVTIVSVDGPTNPYEGQWQNGRLSVTQPERQK